MTMRRPVYLDNHAHTPLDPRVAAAVATAFVELDANPHSTHAAGELARQAVEAGRREIAALTGVDPAEVVLTSGATEANNLALRGFAPGLVRSESRRVLVGAGEHPSVLRALDGVDGVEVVPIPLCADGSVDLGGLDGLLAKGAALVSVAPANHEIGTIQPLAEIARRVRAVGALMHCDLAQTAGRMRVDPALLDLASVSAHKMHGPVGVGALIVRRRLRRLLTPLHRGGEQEGGLRPGTVPTPLVVGFGEACRIARAEMDDDAVRISLLRDRLSDALALVEGMAVNGGGRRLAGNLNVSFEGVDGEALALRVRHLVSLSTGSACTSSSIEPSHVLSAIGLHGRRAEGAIRIGVGRHTTDEEIGIAAEAIATAVRDLRSAVRRAA